MNGNRTRQGTSHINPPKLARKMLFFWTTYDGILSGGVHVSEQISPKSSRCLVGFQVSVSAQNGKFLKSSTTSFQFVDSFTTNQYVSSVKTGDGSVVGVKLAVDEFAKSAPIETSNVEFIGLILSWLLVSKEKVVGQNTVDFQVSCFLFLVQDLLYFFF